MAKTKTKQTNGAPAFEENACSGDSFKGEHDGFTIVVKFQYDEDADLSYMGEFSDAPDDGAIDHHEKGEWLGRSYRGPRYFIPAHYKDALNYYLEHEKLSEEEARAKADRQVVADYERLVEYHQGHWSMLGMIVTVYLDGVKLGDASIWSVESDSGAVHFKELYDDLLHEAVAEARKTLEKLCTKAKELPKSKESGE